MIIVPLSCIVLILSLRRRERVLEVPVESEQHSYLSPACSLPSRVSESGTQMCVGHIISSMLQ